MEQCTARPPSEGTGPPGEGPRRRAATRLAELAVLGIAARSPVSRGGLRRAWADHGTWGRFVAGGESLETVVGRALDLGHLAAEDTGGAVRLRTTPAGRRRLGHLMLTPCGTAGSAIAASALQVKLSLLDLLPCTGRRDTLDAVIAEYGNAAALCPERDALRLACELARLRLQRDRLSAPVECFGRGARAPVASPVPGGPPPTSAAGGRRLWRALVRMARAVSGRGGPRRA